MFFKGSRYADVGDLTLRDALGRDVRYKKTRFIPETGAQSAHVVLQGERLDHIAQLYYRDPERFWRICDANQILWPQDLVKEPGRKILIPSSQG